MKMLKNMPWTKKLSESKLVTLLVITLVMAASVLMLTIPEDRGLSGLNHPVKGQEAPKTIYSQIEFQTEDVVKTRQARSDAKQMVPEYFRRMDDATNRAAVQLRFFFDETAKRAQAEKKGHEYIVPKNAEDAERIIQVKNLPPKVFSYLVLLIDNPNLRKDLLRKIEDEILGKGVLPNDRKASLPHDSQVIVVDKDGREYGPHPLTRMFSETEAADTASALLMQYYDGKDRQEVQNALKDILTRFFAEGNLQRDEALTEQKRAEKIKEVKPLRKTIRNGEPIVEKQCKLTEEHIQLLDDYKLALAEHEAVKATWAKRLEKIALCMVLMLFTCIYIYHIHPEVAKNNKSLWLMAAIAILALLANRSFASVFRFLSEQDNIQPQLIFMALPLGLPAVLISVIYGLRSAIYVGLYVCGIAAVALDNSFSVVVTGLLVSGITGFAVRKATDYKKFFMSAFIVCSMTTFMAGLIFMMNTMNLMNLVGKENLSEIGGQLLLSAALSLATGLLTSVLALVVLFLFESLFDVTTNMAFLAYTDRNNPLLKRLQLEAPGTYHHSERVASIAEKAAEIVDANPMRVQACALFHDIGKLSAPGLFTENSSGGNPHAELTPKESAEVIRRHVSYGLELARKYKLKTPIQNAIVQHHGTDFISFFYNQARERGDAVQEEDFRYEGPLPDRKETALLMLADCAEAISRSLLNPTKDELSAKLDELFRSKILSGQLDDAPVTMREIALLKESFVSSLVAMSHIRIAYPTFETKECPKK